MEPTNLHIPVQIFQTVSLACQDRSLVPRDQRSAPEPWFMLRSTDEGHRPIIALQILADLVVRTITDWHRPTCIHRGECPSTAPARPSMPPGPRPQGPSLWPGASGLCDGPPHMTSHILCAYSETQAAHVITGSPVRHRCFRNFMFPGVRTAA